MPRATGGNCCLEGPCAPEGQQEQLEWPWGPGRVVQVQLMSLTCAQGKLQLELLSAVFVPVQLCNGDGIIKEYKEAR